MPGRLNGRVSRLENGQVEPCEECGFDGDLSKVELEVVWSDLDSFEDRQNDEPTEPEFCGACGHQLVYIVRWGDLPEPPDAA